MSARRERFAPKNVPRYVRCYDAGEGWDRYTVVFTGRYRHNTGGVSWYYGRTGHGEGKGRACIDRPTSTHLGKRIAWEELPEDVRSEAFATYEELWSLKGK